MYKPKSDKPTSATPRLGSAHSIESSSERLGSGTKESMLCRGTPNMSVACVNDTMHGTKPPNCDNISI